MLKAINDYVLRLLLTGLLLAMLTMSVVGTAVSIAADNSPNFALFQDESPSDGPVFVIACENGGGGSQSGCGG